MPGVKLGWRLLKVCPSASYTAAPMPALALALRSIPRRASPTMVG